MVARIFKIIVIVITALIILAIWAGMSLFKGIDLGGTGHPTSPGIIDEYKARKIKMEKMEQLQANLEFVCKHEEKPELLPETQQLYNYALYHDLHNMWTGKRGDAVWNASEQGLGKASNSLGIGFIIDKEYAKALEAFHQGVKNGSSLSASTLEEAFSGKQKEGDMDFLNLSEDPERARRYEIIWKYLAYKDYLQPKVPDLDDIVPLPPAPLPEWDGKIAFQRWFEGEAPPKPSEALMLKLANQAGLRVDNGLDLETGLPREVKK